ncbi:DUF167 domain-containing protein [Sabulicella rubraurantiaca]|uniref:DUF167 domain-containing protein n=1 Tax=Sabulicella rubraurantiaca TaxID=2811429 RepID=UPI001F42119C|nr:DUF167 domain-containing protein [Sabulicella rubraurantiaca]
MTPPWRETPKGVVVALRVTPGARRDAVEGIAEGPDGTPLLRLRVAAPPVEGAANAAVLRLLAKALGVRPSAVTLLAGETARIKRVAITGEAAALAARLAELCRSG